MGCVVVVRWVFGPPRTCGAQGGMFVRPGLECRVDLYKSESRISKGTPRTLSHPILRGPSKPNVSSNSISKSATSTAMGLPTREDNRAPTECAPPRNATTLPRAQHTSDPTHHVPRPHDEHYATRRYTPDRIDIFTPSPSRHRSDPPPDPHTLTTASHTPCF